MEDIRMDPEKVLETIASNLCECERKHKKVKRLKRFTYIMECEECKAQGPLVLPDEDEE